jgi:hypothetical protein
LKRFIRKTYINDIDVYSNVKKDLFETFRPYLHESFDYKNWIAVLDLKTCLQCRLNHGQVYLYNELVNVEPPLHENCRCEIKNINAVFAGCATQDGFNGADYIVKITGELPSNYITKQHAKNLGWVSFFGNLSDVAPGMVIGGDVYKNRNGHLPQVEGRVWYEADINYDSGYRNDHRLIYSNDGLLFATYDHYMTFVQIQ